MGSDYGVYSPDFFVGFGVVVEQLAKALGVDPETVPDFETGGVEADAAAAVAYCLEHAQR